MAQREASRPRDRLLVKVSKVSRDGGLGAAGTATIDSRSQAANAFCMITGTVRFTARIKGNGMEFQSLAFDPNLPGVDHIEINAPDGRVVNSTVHVGPVDTVSQGDALAAQAINAALDRITFARGIAIEGAQRTEHHFVNDNRPGVNAIAGDLVFFMEAVQPTVVIAPDEIRGLMEAQAPLGESRFAMYRAARQSASPVEEFMHLYNLLFMLLGDKQPVVDAFITAQEQGVPQTQSPARKQGVMETIYTRLRNELAHPRQGVDLANTKAEMVDRLDRLAALTKRAIELHP